jgi:hypothetical protein
MSGGSQLSTLATLSTLPTSAGDSIETGLTGEATLATDVAGGATGEAADTWLIGEATLATDVLGGVAGAAGAGVVVGATVVLVAGTVGLGTDVMVLCAMSVLGVISVGSTRTGALGDVIRRGVESSCTPSGTTTWPSLSANTNPPKPAPITVPAAAATFQFRRFVIRTISVQLVVSFG